MDVLIQTLDVLGRCVDGLFIGFCRCVSHCFKFLQLVGMVVDFFLGVLTTLVYYNNLFFSTCIHYIDHILEFLLQVPGYAFDALSYVLYNIFIAAPVTVVTFIFECVLHALVLLKDNAYASIVSFLTWCQVVLPLICNTLANLFLNVCLIPFKLVLWIYENEMNWLRPFLSSSYQCVIAIPQTIYGLITSVSIYSMLDYVRKFSIALGVPLAFIWEYLIYRPTAYVSAAAHWLLLGICQVCRGALKGVLYVIVTLTNALWDPTLVYRCIFFPKKLFTSKTILHWLILISCLVLSPVVYYLLPSSETFLSICPPVVAQLLQRTSVYFNLPAKLKHLSKIKQRTIVQLQSVLRTLLGMLLRFFEQCKRGLVWSLRTINNVNCESVFGRFGRTNSQEDDLNKNCCVVCQDNEKTVVLLPCRHLCLCIVCYRTIKRMRLSQRICPICRVKIEDYISVYM